MATNKRIRKKITKNLYRKGYANLPLTKFEQKKMRKQSERIISAIGRVVRYAKSLG